MNTTIKNFMITITLLVSILPTHNTSAMEPNIPKKTLTHHDAHEFFLAFNSPKKSYEEKKTLTQAVIAVYNLEIQTTGAPSTLFSEAINQNKLDVVHMLINCGADIEQTNHRGNTPLIKAIHEGMDKIASLLIQNKADINAINNRHDTPLSIALIRNAGCYNSLDRGNNIAYKLIKNGAQVNTINNKGLTLLAQVIKQKEFEAAALLIFAGAHYTAQQLHQAITDEKLPQAVSIAQEMVCNKLEHQDWLLEDLLALEPLHTTWLGTTIYQLIADYATPGINIAHTALDENVRILLNNNAMLNALSTKHEAEKQVVGKEAHCAAGELVSDEELAPYRDITSDVLIAHTCVTDINQSVIQEIMRRKATQKAVAA